MMRTPITLALYLFLSVLTSCSDTTGPVKPGEETEKTGTEPAQTATKKQIIFFGPSSSELGAISENDPNYELVETSADFDFYVNAFMTDPGRSDIEILYTDKEQITIYENGESKVIDRTKQDHPFGAIYTDGVNPPLIVTGIHIDDEYRQWLAGYFKQ